MNSIVSSNINIHSLIHLISALRNIDTVRCRNTDIGLCRYLTALHKCYSFFFNVDLYQFNPNYIYLYVADAQDT